MYSFFMKNVDVDESGAVVASPDPNTPGGSYIFHWARDGALCWDTVLQTYNGTDLDAKVQHYVAWVNREHSMQDANNIDIRVEAKFTIPDGTPYTGAWCRPQTDGPALRTITFINYANALIKNGQSAYVTEYLWTSGNYNGGAIRCDMDWLLDNWASSGCDLWEELRSSDLFWNRYVTRKAAFMAADFASQLGDPVSSRAYLNLAMSINATIYEGHWNGQYIFEDVNRLQDAAVICALNTGDLNDGFLSPTSFEVASTVKTFVDLFRATFAINQIDDKAGIPGVLLGRYNGDTYAGGNPWILTSACLANLMYRGATTLLKTKYALPTTEALKTWLDVLHVNGSSVNVDLVTPEILASLMSTMGDGILTRIRYHTLDAGLHQPEQLDRNTGVEVSAYDLSWSYAEIFKAMKARTDFLLQAQL